MLKPLFDSSTISLLEKVAVFGERRHEVLVGNVAHSNTPNYKTRDLPVDAFQHALKNAIARLTNPASLSADSSQAAQQHNSLADLFPEELFQAIESPAKNITFQDANNRSIEREWMELTKNTMMQNFAVELMTAQMNLLQSVISERA